MEACQDSIFADTNVIANAFVESLKSTLQEKGIAPRVIILATLGSWSRAERARNSDYDLLVVCENRLHFQQVVHVVSEIQRHLLASTGVAVSVFTSFRIEELHRALAKEPNCLIHLLMYPSKEAFIRWERPNVVRSMCESAQPILGEKEQLRTIAESLPWVDDVSNIDELASLLYSSYVYLVDGQLKNQDISSREGYHKLQYVVRHIAANGLRKIGKKADSWKSVSEQHVKLGLRTSDVVDSVYEIRALNEISGRSPISYATLLELYDRAFLFLEDVMNLIVRVV